MIGEDCGSKVEHEPEAGVDVVHEEVGEAADGIGSLEVGLGQRDECGDVELAPDLPAVFGETAESSPSIRPLSTITFSGT